MLAEGHTSLGMGRMARLGADVDQLDQLAMRFDRAAARLESNASIIEEQIRSLWWHGSTADQFVASWAAVDRKNLSSVAVSLRGAAKTIRVNAQQQRLASDDSGGFAPVPLPGGTVDGGMPIWGLLGSFLVGAFDSGDAFDLAKETGKFALEWGRMADGSGAWSALSAAGQYLAVVGIATRSYDLVFETRDDGLAWLETTADALAIGGGVVILSGCGAPIGVAMLGGAVLIDAGLFVYDNWDTIEEWGGTAADWVGRGAEALAAPYIEFGGMSWMSPKASPSLSVTDGNWEERSSQLGKMPWAR